MLMAGDGKKKIAAMIVAKFGPKGSEEAAEGPKPGGDIDPGLLATAEEAHSALKADDVPGFARALKAFFDQCEAMPEADEEGDKEEETHPVLG